LLGAGAVLVCLDQDGLTPFLYAIRHGSVDTVVSLLERAQPHEAFGTAVHQRDELIVDPR